MIDYKEFSIKNESIRLDGKNGFFMFLQNIDELKKTFIKTNSFLNTGKFLYFFSTDVVKKKEELIESFDDLLSVKNTFKTIVEHRENRLSFYFGVKGKKLEYGLHNDTKMELYKTGEFEIDNKYLRRIKSYKCLTLIGSILKNSNINNLILLREIKNHMKHLHEDKPSKCLILNELYLKKTIRREYFKEEQFKDENGILNYYEQWCERFVWAKKVFYYVDVDEENVTFYIKIKPRQEKIEQYGGYENL
jgi:hypothetical protein